MELLILSYVNILINFELDELCEWDIEISNLIAIEEPLTIIINIINNIDIENIDIFIVIIINKEIINISSLNIIKIIFFRHQHILIILIKIIIFVILDFSTSKVDIFYKLLRTFGNINFFINNIFY